MVCVGYQSVCVSMGGGTNMHCWGPRRTPIFKVLFPIKMVLGDIWKKIGGNVGNSVIDIPQKIQVGGVGITIDKGSVKNNC